MLLKVIVFRVKNLNITFKCTFQKEFQMTSYSKFVPIDFFNISVKLSDIESDIPD